MLVVFVFEIKCQDVIGSWLNMSIILSNLLCLSVSLAMHADGRTHSLECVLPACLLT